MQFNSCYAIKIDKIELNKKIQKNIFVNAILSLLSVKRNKSPNAMLLAQPINKIGIGRDIINTDNGAKSRKLIAVSNIRFITSKDEFQPIILMNIISLIINEIRINVEEQ